MIESDFSQFAAIWVDAQDMSVNGKVPSESVMTKIFIGLEKWPIAVVDKAISMHSTKNKFAPTLADIIEIIETHSASKHVSPDEAWIIAVESFDEFATVALTSEISQAKAIIQDVYQSGDTTGARMAFRAAYERIIKTAPAPKWFMSIGFDAQGRSEGAKKALRLGRITQEQAQPLLIDYTPQTTVTKLIEQSKRLDAVDKIAEIKKILDDPEARNFANDAEQRREKFERLKQEQEQKIQEKLKLN
jgi:N-acyl-D-aspartate/D-glutamate deacylase